MSVWVQFLNRCLMVFVTSIMVVMMTMMASFIMVLVLLIVTMMSLSFVFLRPFTFDLIQLMSNAGLAADTWSSLNVTINLSCNWWYNSSGWFMFITRLVKNHTNSRRCVSVMNFMSFQITFFFFSHVRAKSNLCFGSMIMLVIMRMFVCFRMMRSPFYFFRVTWWGRWLSHYFTFFLYFFFAWCRFSLYFFLLRYCLLRSGWPLGEWSKWSAIEINFAHRSV